MFYRINELSMLYIEQGSMADWAENTMSSLGILVASFFTVWYYRKDKKKTWKMYKNIELKRIIFENGMENYQYFLQLVKL